MGVAQRIMDLLHEQALIEDEERDWERTGLIRCSDCGARVRTQTLETLPDHRCTQRQCARRDRVRAEAQAAGAAVDNGLTDLFRRLGPPPTTEK